MSVWKQIFLLVCLAGIAFGAYEGYRIHLAPTESDAADSGARPVTVAVAPVEFRVLKQTVEAVGTSRARRTVDIVPEADGRLVELALAPGAMVREGDTLARLDDRIERTNLVEAEARLTEQRQTLDRIEQLRLTNAAAEATLEEATARLAEARADLDRARRQLEDRVIRAPFDGVVGLTDVDVGARVSSGQVLARLDDLSEVEIEFSLPETLFSKIRPGQAVEATSAAFGDLSFAGTIDAVDSRIDPVSRSFRTRAVVPNPDNTLPAGMFMSLTLTLSETKALVVPEEAIIFEAAETYVFVAEDGTANRQTVVTGQRQDGVVAVTSGLGEDQQVVVRGLQRVRNGSPIRIDDADPPGNGGDESGNGS